MRLNPNQHYATASDMLTIEQTRLVKALNRQTSRMLSVLDKLTPEVKLDYMTRLRIEELDRAIAYLRHQQGWTELASQATITIQEST